jgi:hypothetical protein
MCAANFSTDKDTRERPKKHSYRAATRLPKARTRSGCFTCRKRKKKCDETGPTCSGCARNFLKCIWPTNSAETLPKDFRIASCSDQHFENLNDEQVPKAIATVDEQPKRAIKSIEYNKSVVTTESISEDSESLNLPPDLCSIFEIQSYKHQIPFPLSTTIPDSIDFVASISAPAIENKKNLVINTKGSHSSNSLSHLIPCLDESYVNHQTITDMFDSLYSASLVHLSPANDTSSPDYEVFYNDLLNHVPKNSFPTVSIKNPIIASFREIFFARGCMFLSKTNCNNMQVSIKYNDAAKKHYNNSVTIVSDSIGSYYLKPDSYEHWSVFAIKTLCTADQLLGLVSENCISNLISVDSKLSIDEANLTLNGLKDTSGSNLNKVLFSQLLFVYPFLVYFSKFDSLLSLLQPEVLFQRYNKEMIEIFVSADEKTANNDMNWLENVLRTAIINIIQNLTKLMWLLRMKNSIEMNELINNLKQLKTDISLIWTTIQTAEVQFESHNPLIEFAKLSHMSLEILFLKISDASVDASSPIIGFYLDQFMASYETYLKSIKSDENLNGDTDSSSSEKVPKCFMLLPLFIASCASQTLMQKEFMSKELYILSRNLGYEFFESLTMAIEDAWCSEENSGVKAFTRLVSREGFATLVNQSLY